MAGEPIKPKSAGDVASAEAEARKGGRLTEAKSSIQSMLDKFLDDSDKSGALKPVPTKVPDILSSSPGPVPLPVPLASNPTPKNKSVTN